MGILGVWATELKNRASAVLRERCAGATPLARPRRHVVVSYSPQQRTDGCVTQGVRSACFCCAWLVCLVLVVVVYRVEFLLDASQL